MRIEYLYNDKSDISTFYVWNGMSLMYKVTYQGEMSSKEVQETKKHIRKKTSKNSRNNTQKENK
jgi:hypothetical protein